MNIETKVCKDLRGMSHIWRRPWPSCCPQPSSSVQCRCPARRPSRTSWTCWGCFSTVPSHRRYSSQCQDCSPLQYLRATNPLIYQSHDVLHLCHKSEHSNIKHFIPAFSLNFFNVSASFICAWIWAFNSCIFFKFSTICRLNINNRNISIHNWIKPDYFNNCWGKS